MFGKLHHSLVGWVMVAVILATGYYVALTYPNPADDALARGEVYIYFVDDSSNATDVLPVRRDIKKNQSLEVAIPLVAEELFKGPTGEERDGGLSTAIPEGVQLVDSRMEGKTAVLNFNDRIEQVAGSATVLLIRKQLEMTFDHLPGVLDVELQVGGRPILLEP